jgi:lipid A 3-O-deacylase
VSRAFRFRALIGGLLAVALGAADARAQAQDPSFLAVGGGAFDVFDEDTRAAQFDLQYRSDLKLWIFQPMVGVNVSTDESIYAYAGLSLDIFFGNRVVLRPSVAPGLYRRGDAKDLGGTVEFRSAVELAFRFDNRSRLGVEVSHRSNAGIYDRNPGEESLTLFYHIPLGSR